MGDYLIGVESDRSSGVLPREFHQVFLRRILERFRALQRVRPKAPVLFQHRRDGDRLGEMESRRVHEKDRDLDGDSEGEEDLRAGFSSAVSTGFRRRRGGDSPPVEPARPGRR